jgi:riboflavin kinase/FMN adenylyltransferase
VERLRELGTELNYVVNVLKPIQRNGQIVSSSLIRKYIREGKIDGANQLLGRLYQVGGVVIEGDGRGKSIGIPTANLDLGDERLCPLNGVYACLVDFDGEIRPAATNIGYRPTFDGSGWQPQVETHVIGFEGDLYGKKLEIQFLARLRSEQKFNSVRGLVLQIEEDIKSTKGIFMKYMLAEFSN